MYSIVLSIHKKKKAMMTINKIQLLSYLDVDSHSIHPHTWTIDISFKKCKALAKVKKLQFERMNMETKKKKEQRNYIGPGICDEIHDIKGYVSLNINLFLLSWTLKRIIKRTLTIRLGKKIWMRMSRIEFAYETAKKNHSQACLDRHHV